MRPAALTALALTLAWALVRKGGARAEDLLPCLLAVSLLTVFYRLGAPRLAPPLRRTTALLLFSLPAVAALELLPLPAALVRVLSPARYELEQAASVVTGRSGALTLSASPAAGFEALLTLLGCVLVFLLVRELSWSFPRAAAAPLIVLAVLEAALGVAQVYADPQDVAHGTFVNRDHFAFLLALCLPLPVCAGLACYGRRVAVACALFAGSAALLIAVVFSQSRMGFIAALFGLAVAAASAISRRAFPALLVAAAILFILLPTGAMVGRFADLASASEASVVTRAALWRETLPLLRDYPLAGCGLGAYESVMCRYKTVAPLNTADYAHNDYLQLLAETGAAGFLPALALAVVLVVTAARRAVRRPRDARAWLASACLGSLAAILLHSFFDFSLHIPADALAAAWVAGLASAPD